MIVDYKEISNIFRKKGLDFGVTYSNAYKTFWDKETALKYIAVLELHNIPYDLKDHTTEHGSKYGHLAIVFDKPFQVDMGRQTQILNLHSFEYQRVEEDKGTIVIG
jgi:alpha-L-fucosidase